MESDAWRSLADFGELGEQQGLLMRRLRGDNVALLGVNETWDTGFVSQLQFWDQSLKENQERVALAGICTFLTAFMCT